jgi:hypothetical protein
MLRERHSALDSAAVFWSESRGSLRRAGGATLRIANLLVFPAWEAEVGRPEAARAQAKFQATASQILSRHFHGLSARYDMVPAQFGRVLLVPFKGKPGVSRGRKASGL